MSNIAEKRAAAQSVGPRPPQGAVSYGGPFEAIAKIVDLSVPLRRPKKRAPETGEQSLQQELDAWDAASDEALQSFEDSLGEQEE